MQQALFSPETPQLNNAWAVDASCLGNPGPMEYRGVDLSSGRQIFIHGKLWGTNNIGEFLAIVHALALIERDHLPITMIYTDSVTALAWIRNKHCKSKLPQNETSQPTFDLINRAEKWLRTHSYQVAVRKWDTENWGEIPADFGRK